MLKHTGLILPVNNHENHAVTAIAWSADGTILAVALHDNTIYTFHRGVTKHNHFQVECSIPAMTKSNNSIKDIAFSADSTNLAVAHAKGAVSVHNIQHEWTSDTKTCIEFLQNSPVTCLVWSSKGPVVFGLDNGKVRASRVETEMTWTLYSADSPTIALAVNDDAGTGVLSSHTDGSIFHCNLTLDGSIHTANRILTCLAVPQVLAWARDDILVGDRDRRVVFYDCHGKKLKTFDYHGEMPVDENSCCSSAKTSIAVNLCGKLHVYTSNKENKFWEEIDSSAANVVGIVTTLALKKDGSKLAIGGLDGVVTEFKLIKSVNDANKAVGMLVRNVDSNLVSEISLVNDNGLAGTTIWPAMRACNSTVENERNFEKLFDEKLKLEKPMKIEKELIKTKYHKDAYSSSLFVKEAQYKGEVASSFSTWTENNDRKVKSIEEEIEDWKQMKAKNVIDYISSDIASTYDKSSFTMDFGSIILSSEEDEEEEEEEADEWNLTMEDKTKAKIHRVKSMPRPLVADGMLLQNLNDIPYDPTIDPPCWKGGELHRSDKTRSSCHNCGRLDVSMRDCPRCKDAYRNWDRQTCREDAEAVSSPIRFTRQYTAEELRADFTLQLALLASLSPGLQRIFEEQIFSSKRDRSCS